MEQNATELDLATNDLGPLAWVLDELRKSLDSSAAALRRFVRDTSLARGADMASVDGGHLRIARQQLHQAVGALEMVGLGAPAQMLRSMEAAVQKFIEKADLCNEIAAGKVERAGFALTEYLESVLLGKNASAVALFPQYRDVQELAGADRVHPADLWDLEWRWNDPETPTVPEARVYDPAVRGRMDQAVLKVVKTGDSQAAGELTRISLSLAATQAARQPRIFWKICAAYFEAVGLGLLPLDIYVKRAASRVLLQYASLSKGELGVSDRLAQDLVFFCSQAIPPREIDAPSLVAVRRAWGLSQFARVDYQTAQYGRFDPVLVSQARKRIAAAKELWSSLSGGDTGKLKGLADQFQLVSDSLLKLHPPSAPLAASLSRVIETVVRSARPPETELAMEVATAVLYLEAAFEDLDPADAELEVRTSRLAERLDAAREGGKPEPLESWMEELYRRVSDRQTMGSVVGELRGTLGELEKLLDQFFRNPQDKAPLRDAPGHLAQMRGVLSVLGLDQAAQAVSRMRDSVEEILVTEIDEQLARAAGTFDKLGNNLGALGFLIDMLNYQPSLAKKLFVYDDGTGELRPLMGRAGQGITEHKANTDELHSEVQALVAQVAIDSREDLAARLDSIASQAVLAEETAIAHQAREAAAAMAAEDTGATNTALSELAAAVQPQSPVPAGIPAEPDIEEDDLRDIFLEEAREVVQHGLDALRALASNPADVSELTTLRRAFHTLKGSSRMVGLTEFGEAAWSLEQVLNTWLADQKSADDDLRGLAGDAMLGFGRWIEDIAGDHDQLWRSGMFRIPADAMRTEHRRMHFELPQYAAAVQPPGVDSVVEPLVTATPDPDPTPGALFAETATAEPEVHEVSQQPDIAETVSFDLDILQPDAPSELKGAAQELSANIDFDLPASVEHPIGIEVVEVPQEIDGIDFASLSAVAGPAKEGEPADAGMAAGTSFELIEAIDEFDSPEIAESVDDQVKVIGSLRIGIPLYNVYLNEADEWSRRLATEVAEWALELTNPIPDSAVGLAHALAGSSATVGFNALSEIARALENELMRTQKLAYVMPAHGKAFTDAAEEIRRLLHQFAAGFLKEPNPGVIQAMLALKEFEIPQRAELPEEDFLDDEYLDLPLDAQLADEPGHPPEPTAPGPAEVLPFVAEATESDVPSPIPSPMPHEGVRRVVPVTEIRTIPDVGIPDEEDFDVADAIDPDLLPIFVEEALELMPQLGGVLRQWAARPDNRSARDEALRVLHTLKGSARLAGALRLGELAHRMESDIEQLGAETSGAADLEALLHRFDGMQANFDALRADDVTPELPQIAPTPKEEQGGAPVAPADRAETVAHPQPDAAAAPSRALLARPVQTNLGPQRAAANQAVRVRSQLLDRLVNQAGEVMITRSRLESELRQLRGSLTDLTGNLDRLRAQLRDIELHSESQMQSRLAQTKDTAAGFDPLEFDRFTRVQELTRMMAESVNDVATVQRNLQRTVESTEDDLIAQARQTRELQRDLLRTRMVEFEGIADRLYRVIRLASKETGKQVKLDITGGSIEMDRGVLDRMTPAFEHLLRNCVAHGIEDPAVRTAVGKDPIGTIVIGLYHEGNDVSVEFRDDGAGLNLPRIREKAVNQGLVAAGQELTDEDAAQLIFMPGFSTAAEVTELSGRGIGMDVVRAEVNALGGRIETSTSTGKGTSFKLVLPLTTAVTQVVMIRSGSLSIGVPANLVEVVRRATAKEVEQAYNTGFFDLGDDRAPFHWSGALLQASPHSTEPQTKTLPVVVFRSAAQRIAVHVDEVLGNQEVVVKNLGPQLSRLPGLAGMTVLASGAVVLIYNPVALTAVYGRQARELSADRAQADVLGIRAGEPVRAEPATSVVPQIPLILVVDDSITVRRVTQRLLQREGYRVALAADGLQALERLAEEKPAVVLSDIEMPRMDGFDLARNIRADGLLQDLPIIMITSRIAEKHREHAKELGVDHYLGKPYSEEELLSLIKRYCATTLA